MKCSCGRPYPMELPIVGIQYYPEHVPYLILWNCVCGSTRAQNWADATERERRDALNVELTRASRCEMTGWGG